MPIRTDGPAPYTSPSAILALVEGYRTRGLQTPFNVDVLVRAGVSETLAPRTIQSLKLLDLIDERGEPTPALVELRKAGADEFKDRLAALVRAAYAEVFSYVDPATDSAERVRDAFRSYEPVGQQPRMVTLFLGLCDAAGILGDNRPKRRTSANGPAERPERRRPKQPQAAKPEPETITLFKPAPAQAGGHPLIQGLLRELPPVGATWPNDKKKAWIELAGVILNLLYTIEDPAPEDRAPEGSRARDVHHDEGGEKG